jgi:aldose 1-epimerase
VTHHVLQAGAYRAAVSEQGAALRSLRHAGRDLVHDRSGDVPHPPYAGALLAPWPNRIGRGRYEFAGADHQLPINEVARRNALHGLVLWDRWDVREVGEARLVLEHLLLPRPGYPFTILLEARYELTDAGLTQTIAGTNVGLRAAPIGLGTHPYLTAGTGPLDDWTLQLPCHQVVDVDADLLPTGTASVADAGLDFRVPRRIGEAVIDHAFTGTSFDADGRATARLLGPEGRGVEVGWRTEAPWLQIYTLQLPGQEGHRSAVAIEPMTCAPDAFTSGDGLVVLEPGDGLSMETTFASLDGAAAL